MRQHNLKTGTKNGVQDSRDSRRTKLSVRKLALFGLTLGIVASTGTPAVAAAPPSPDYVGIESGSVAAPTAGGRVIYVDDQGTDINPVQRSWGMVDYSRITCLDTGVSPVGVSCPEPDIDHPLKTVQGAVKAAHPGDVIVVREGTYDEKIGWSARAAQADAPIVLQSYPKERAQINGYLSLKNADYWTVKGIHFGYSDTNTTGQAIVNFFGGDGWSFISNEVSGTHGVANMIVREDETSSTVVEDRIAAAPHDYLIGANCIHDASTTGTGIHGQMHNIYVMPTIWSSGGRIEHNLLAGAPMGSNLKLGGSQDPNGSPRDVIVNNNTMLYGASGMTIGLGAEGIETQGNLIAKPNNSTDFDGGVKTYKLPYANLSSVKDTLISGYVLPFKTDWEAPNELFKRRNVTPDDVVLTGSVANCTARAADPVIRSTYGHYGTKF